MPGRWTILMAGMSLLLGAGRPVGPGGVPGAPHEARMVADRTIRDVAVAVYDPADPVIYYNPDLMARFSPELQDFFVAHEQAHIALRHTRRGLEGLSGAGRARALQAKELEADCVAARRPGPGAHQAAVAAAAFFARLGSARFDEEHPSGSARAAGILSCLPAQGEWVEVASASRSR